MGNYCEKCKHWKLWQAAADACRCCVNAESHQGKSHVAATEFTLSQPRPVDFDRSPSGQATNLSPDDEDKLRRAMTALFSLDPIELLLVQHLMRERSLDSFGDVLARLNHQTRNYRGRDAARESARKFRILAKFPQFRAVLQTASEHDAASRAEREIDA